ncbi:ABC transporter permease [Ruminococcaceae bacterium OttesenSCG-928-D13]|nr:ABC transporter permease [Ruminococcaceae bacterium OttesenSCG-928-D13]
MRASIRKSFSGAYENTSTRIFLLLFGVLFFIPAVLFHLARRGGNEYNRRLREMKASIDVDALRAEVTGNIQKKLSYFKRSEAGLDGEVTRVLQARLDEEAKLKLARAFPLLKPFSFTQSVLELLDTTAGMLLYCTLGLPAVLFAALMTNAFVRYTFGRLLLVVFVVFGVTFLVFTILHFSPMDPAYNILGQLATAEQVEQFHKAYGLDQPYIVQLVESFKGIVTLNPGKSFLGSEDVITMIVNRLPITMELTFASLLLAVAIAVPTGMLSALKPYSILDYVVMLLALIGLSMPSFWMGLILIYNCSIKLGWFPVSFIQGDWRSYVMPVIVLGTGMMASVARTTRSSMLEVLGQDYIVTAKAKGLSRRKVIMRHALGNAMIPIVTIIGIQFGSMMSGATVVEKVFNINGLGNLLVDRQFVPDIPVVLAGVVYVAIAVSLVNLLVDLLYAFLDPRIKAKIKGY